MEFNELSDFQTGYLESLLWSCADFEYEKFSFGSMDDLVDADNVDLTDAPTVEHLKSVQEFFDKWQSIWHDYWCVSQAAHDLALTRNGHGSGFWDRYYLPLAPERKLIENKLYIRSVEGYARGKLLSAAAKLEGSCYIVPLSGSNADIAELYSQFKSGNKVFNRYIIR